MGLMRNDLSIVIICRNEAGNIERVLESLKDVSDDIMIYDNGSTDDTLEILKHYPVNLQSGPWLGYGTTKHKAVTLARHDWILSLDADESIDEKLKSELLELDLDNPEQVYSMRFKNFLGDKYLKWGEWGTDWHTRLFNRQRVNWDKEPVHEKLLIPGSIVVKKLQGFVLHRTMKDTIEYSNKMVRYALLNAEKYYEKGKRSGPLKRYAGPAFAFLKYYVFKLGFLDGWEGLLSARMTAFYTNLKYARLYELWKKRKSGS
jgi:glycosyltransferase involved in cell wall biosynthesis